jgi:sarcosine oxidase, subunit delta
MLLVPCPHCGPRPEVEFRCGGEAHIRRPDPTSVTDQEWVEICTTARTRKGAHQERWCHLHGCGRWFNAARDTVSDQFAAEGPESAA